jgi:hypothetical protein
MALSEQTVRKQSFFEGHRDYFCIPQEEAAIPYLIFSVDDPSVDQVNHYTFETPEFGAKELAEHLSYYIGQISNGIKSTAAEFCHAAKHDGRAPGVNVTVSYLPALNTQGESVDGPIRSFSMTSLNCAESVCELIDFLKTKNVIGGNEAKHLRGFLLGKAADPAAGSMIRNPQLTPYLT